MYLFIKELERLQVVASNLNEQCEFSKFIKKHGQAIAGIIGASMQASFCLRELLPNDEDAKMTVNIINNARAKLEE